MIDLLFRQLQKHFLPPTSRCKRRRKTRMTQFSSVPAEILESRMMLTAPDILFVLQGGYISQGLWGSPVKSVEFNSGEAESFDISYDADDRSWLGDRFRG